MKELKVDREDDYEGTRFYVSGVPALFRSERVFYGESVMVNVGDEEISDTRFFFRHFPSLRDLNVMQCDVEIVTLDNSLSYLELLGFYKCTIGSIRILPPSESLLPVNFDITFLSPTKLPEPTPPDAVYACSDVSLTQVDAYEFPRWLCADTVRSVEMRRCTFRHLPPEFGVMRELEKWNIEQRDEFRAETELWIRELPSFVGNFTKLKKARLCFAAESFPESVGNWEKLENLTLHTPNLTSLPTSIGRWKRLKSLIIHQSKLTRLPSSIGSCKKLKKLEIETDSHIEFPPSFSNLTSLRNLTIDASEGMAFPSNIGDLPNLQQVTLYSPGIRSELPPSFWSLPKLQRLKLEGGFVIPLHGMENAKELRTLNVDSTSTERIPRAIGRLQNLQSLRIHRNRLRYLPPEIADLPKLKPMKLNRGNSPIIWPPFEVTRLPWEEMLQWMRDHRDEYPFDE